MGTARARRHYQGPALLSHGFRPFFLAASGFSALAMALWLAGLWHGWPAADAVDMLSWHRHEMLFGYLGAVLAGFLMTAIPNWTGRLPVMGAPLAAFTLLWLAGRFAMLAAPMGALAVTVIDAAFPALLALFAWREVISGGNWRNAPVCVLVTLFALADVISHVEAGFSNAMGFGERFGLAIAALLIALIGGRIVPSFTLNWMKRENRAPLPASFNRYDQLALVGLGLALALWAGAPESAGAGILLLLAGALHLGRLARWRGWRTLSEPLVAILHLGYAWLGLALVLMGLGALWPDVMAPSAALHALTVGAIGHMTVGVMTRASLGHTGHGLTAGPATIGLYTCLFIAALLRIAAPYLPMPFLIAISFAGFFWIAAFALFVVIYAPLLLAPRRGADGDG
ncbi:MAG: NnrS family protein [Pseudomonadota bacterium]